MTVDPKKQARELLIDALKKKDIEVDKSKIIIAPASPVHGDLASPLSYDLAHKLKKSPMEIAEEIVEGIDISKASMIESVAAVNGYINFSIEYKAFSKEVLSRAVSLGEEYGCDGQEGKIILEHTSANPDGPLHIGHGRNTIIGDCLARILRFSGYEVETQFYVNDMGKQLAVVVFGLGKLELDESKKNDHGIAVVYAKANKILEEDPAHNDEISKLMRSYEADDEETVSKFKNAAEYCLGGIKETLDRLGVEHDTYVWEGRFVRDKSVKKIVDELAQSKYAKKDEVLLLELEDFGIEKELILTRRDGTYLYTTRDLAYHLWKSKAGHVIDVWGADHKLVAQQMRAALKILGEEEPEFIIYEFITLPKGSMSTRRGVYISVDDLIDESIRRALVEVEKRRPDAPDEEKKKIAEMVGVGAVRFNIVRIAPEKGMVFKWEEALDFERQGAPFIQYAHARACRILEKAELKKDFEAHELSEYEKKLVSTISKLPDVIQNAADSRRPSMVASYALTLADDFNRFYKFEPVLKSKEVDFRLNLVEATRIALRNALTLLGIDAPERM